MIDSGLVGMQLQAVALFLFWLPWGIALTMLSHNGWAVIGMNEWVAWCLAMGNTLASAIFAHRFRVTGDVVHLLFCAMALLVATGTDGASFWHKLSTSNVAPAAAAQARADQQEKRLQVLEESVRATDARLQAKRQEAAAEGPTLQARGPKWEALMAEAEVIAGELDSARERWEGAIAEAGEVRAAAVVAGFDVTLLAKAPLWAIFLGCGIVEICAAALAYGAGERARVQEHPAVAQGIDGVMAMPRYAAAGTLEQAREFERMAKAIRREHARQNEGGRR